jgi:predicted transcriptional regulator
MLTDFGKMVKKLMVDADISQGQLAKDLGISPAILSNYMTGKNVPEMKMVEKCIKRFGLEHKKIQEIFTKAFTSTAKANQSIHLDTRFFKVKRLDLLVMYIPVKKIRVSRERDPPVHRKLIRVSEVEIHPGNPSFGKRNLVS